MNQEVYIVKVYLYNFEFKDRISKCKLYKVVSESALMATEMVERFLDNNWMTTDLWNTHTIG